MSENNLWKLVDRMEQLTEHIEEMNDYLDQVHEHHIAYNNWIQVATESLISLQKDINYLKNKRDCI